MLIIGIFIGIFFSIFICIILGMSKIDLKALTMNVKKKKTNRSKTSFYLDQDVYKEFLKKCDKQGVSGSKILEEFMKEYLK
jgi:hypothetical protein